MFLIKWGMWTKFAGGQKLKPKKTEGEMTKMNIRSLKRDRSVYWREKKMLIRIDTEKPMLSTVCETESVYDLLRSVMKSLIEKV